MSKRVRSEVVFIIGALLGGLLSACGGGKDVPLTDGGRVDVDTGTGDDGGVPPRWPVPSDFPADGPMQPGEGDACQLSVQCAEDRQICVDDACVREERVTSAGLVLGDWRVLTPAEVRATTVLPIAEAASYVRPVLDERGEVTVVGTGIAASGNGAVFAIGARTRFLELASGVTIGDARIPAGDGFLSDSDVAVSYVGSGGTVEWSAGLADGGPTRTPLDINTPGFTRSLIHTPEGPLIVLALDEGARGEWNVIGIQRLDLSSRRFVFMDFAAGPYLFNRRLGHAVVGPTGLELIVAEQTADEGLGRFYVHTVATGAERPLGTGPFPWEVDVQPVSSNRWVAVMLRDSLTSPCRSLAFTSESSDPAGSILVFGSDTSPGQCEWPSDSVQVSPPLMPSLFCPSPIPAAWITTQGADGLVEAASVGTAIGPLGVPSEHVDSIASRFGKTREVFSGTFGAEPDPGLWISERTLRRAPGGM